MFYNLYYFKKSHSICGDDFNLRDKLDAINLSLVSSLSSLEKFHLPFSDTFVGNYAILTMNNGDKYYIKKESFMDVREVIFKFNRI